MSSKPSLLAVPQRKWISVHEVAEYAVKGWLVSDAEPQIRHGMVFVEIYFGRQN